MCDITPAWLLTSISSTARERAWRSFWVSAFISGSDHVAVGGARWHHGVDLLFSIDPGMDQAGAGAGDSLHQRSARVCGLIEVDCSHTEALGDLDEIRCCLELRGEKSLTVDQGLLLMHEAQCF